MDENRKKNTFCKHEYITTSEGEKCKLCGVPRDLVIEPNHNAFNVAKDEPIVSPYMTEEFGFNKPRKLRVVEEKIIESILSESLDLADLEYIAKKCKAEGALVICFRKPLTQKGLDDFLNNKNNLEMKVTSIGVDPEVVLRVQDLIKKLKQ